MTAAVETKKRRAPAGLDLRGRRFDRLTVVGEAQPDSSRSRRWDCLCDCGSAKSARTNALISGSTRSCGCHSWGDVLQRLGITDINVLSVPGSNGLATTYRGMVERCHNKEHVSYHQYGARGISVCDEWLADPHAFYEYVGLKPTKSHTLDRVDNEGDYGPGNVRWATKKQQARNMRTNRLTPELVRNLRALSATGISMMKSGRLLCPDVPYNTVQAAIKGKTWAQETRS